MDNFVDERDFKLLESDTYTFFVMRRILGADCNLLLTDHEQLIINQCKTAPFQCMRGSCFYLVIKQYYEKTKI